MTEWFEQWFGEEYLRLYPHRDDDDAAALVSLIGRYLPLAGRRVLDLACGAGRHAGILSDRGAQVVGFDLSLPLLARARARLASTVHLVRGDMRALPFRDGVFDLVTNLFTSFGYFAEDAEHGRVLAEAARVAAPGGVLLLDYFDADTVRRTLVSQDEREAADQRVVITRRISEDDRFVIKEIHLRGDGRTFRERVRLFSPAELSGLLQAAGFTVRHQFGDYAGRPPGPGAPRAIFLAERACP